jgi:hypothetical protein
VETNHKIQSKNTVDGLIARPALPEPGGRFQRDKQWILPVSEGEEPTKEMHDDKKH